MGRSYIIIIKSLREIYRERYDDHIWEIDDGLEICLEHSADEFIDFGFTVTPVTSGVVWMSLGGVALAWGGEFEWPEEIVGGLEVSTAVGDFVDQIFHADQTLFAKVLFNNFVAGEWDSLAVDLSETTFVDELGDQFLGWVTIGDVWFDLAEHVGGGLADADEGGVVELTESQQLKDLADDWGKVVDTSDSDNEVDLWLIWDEESTSSSCLSLLGNDLSSLVGGFLVIFLTTFQVFSLLLSAGLLQGGALGGVFFFCLSVTFFSAEDVLWSTSLLLWGGSSFSAGSWGGSGLLWLLSLHLGVCWFGCH